MPFLPFPALSRRQFLRATGLSPLALGFDGPRTSAQDKLPAPALVPLNRFPRTVQEWYVEQVRAAEKRGEEERAKLKTKADAEAYVRGVREKIAMCFGRFPDKTPLNAKVTGKLERDAYTIEKVIFESRPGFDVTANLYVPHAAKKGKKLPGVVGSCGHSHNGKAEPAYQSFCQGLARMGDGYVVLLSDLMLPKTTGANCRSVNWFTSPAAARMTRFNSLSPMRGSVETGSLVLDNSRRRKRPRNGRVCRTGRFGRRVSLTQVRRQFLRFGGTSTSGVFGTAPGTFTASLSDSLFFSSLSRTTA